MSVEIDYKTAAIECARYIFDSESEQDGYEEFIQEGNDPRDHILYHAAIILGYSKDFETDINEYLQDQSEYNEASNTQS